MTAPDVTSAVERVRVPIPGQSFSSQQDWTNRATRSLTSHPDYLNTEHGENRGWRGPHFTALCFDQAGNRMRNGGDFMRATKEGTYPVWWIWPDQIATILSDHARLSAALGEAREALAGDREVRPLSEERLDRILEFHERVGQLSGPDDTASLSWADQVALIEEAVCSFRARTALQQQEARDGRE